MPDELAQPIVEPTQNLETLPPIDAQISVQTTEDIESFFNSGTPADQIAAHIIELDQSNPEQAKILLDQLRVLRMPGSGYRYNNPKTIQYDNVLINLLTSDHVELASHGISASPNEISNFDFSTSHMGLPDEEKSLLSKNLATLVEEKQSDLLEQLQKNGVPTDVSEVILERSLVPETALLVEPKLWPLLDGMPYDSKIAALTSSTRINRSLNAIGFVNEPGFEGIDKKYLLLKLERCETIEQQAKYAQGMLYAVRKINEAFDGKPNEWEKIKVTNSIFKFSDPAEAVEACLRLYGEGEIEQLPDLANLLEIGFETESGIKISPEKIESLALLRSAFSELGLDDSGVVDQVLLPALVNKPGLIDDPIKFTNEIISTVPKIKGLLNAYPDIMLDIGKCKEPGHVIDALSKISSMLLASPEIKYVMLIDSISRSDNPDKFAENILLLYDKLTASGVNFADFPYINSMTLVDKMTKAGAEDENINNEIKRSASDWKVKDQVTKAYGELVPEKIKKGWRGEAEPPDLEKMPELHTRLAELGFDETQIKYIARSWFSYDAIKRFVYLEEEAGRPLKSDDTSIPRLIEEQTRAIFDQLGAITSFADRYGQEELMDVMNTFGIVNFGRFSSNVDLLHDQLAEWRTGAEPVVNIVASAHSDWNGNLNNSLGEYIKTLGSSGLFFFEVGSPKELARFAVAIGNRERSNGREPTTNNSLQNFVIHAHANPETMRLGAGDNGLLDTDLYREAAKKRQKIDKQTMNDYRRHLGNNFRIILQGCSTSGKPLSGKNIAESISIGHRTQVESSPFNTNGVFNIAPDGTVIFKVSSDESGSDEIESNQYDNRQA